jgi:uncharacterized protein YabE (DUF348 family)
MKKIYRILFALFVIAMIFTGTASAYEAESKQVQFSLNGAAATEVQTYASTVEEFFKEQNITIGTADKISPDLSTTLQSGSIITYTSYCEITLIIDGVNTKVPVKKDAAVGEIIADYSKQTGIDYDYNQALKNLKVKNGAIIEITSEDVTKVFEEITAIPFETETVSNPELNEGVQNILIAGADGEQKTTVKVTFDGGKEVARETVATEITKEPVKQVIEIGAANTINGIDGVYQFEKELTMNASAYTADFGSTGKNPGDPSFGITASGRVASVGVVAVDPAVIPLGTELYIEGYGHAVAGDTGSAIKGHKIDLFFNTYSECIQFGRQDITVYVLKQD